MSSTFPDCPKDLKIDHFDILDSFHTFDLKLIYVKILIKINFAFKEETNPETWIERLIYADGANPKKIVKFIKEAFGANLICKDQSSLMGHPITIIDAICNFIPINKHTDTIIRETYMGLISSTLCDYRDTR